MLVYILGGATACAQPCDRSYMKTPRPRLARMAAEYLGRRLPLDTKATSRNRKDFA